MQRIDLLRAVHATFFTDRDFCLSGLGISGAIILILAHGLRSILMFFEENLFYERKFSRRLLIMRGFLSSLPLLSFFLIFYNDKRNSNSAMNQLSFN